MDDFYRLFHVNSQYRILIYTDYQYAVVPTQIGKHLRAHHIRLSLQQRRAIISRVEELVGLARVHLDYSTSKPVCHRHSWSARPLTMSLGGLLILGTNFGPVEAALVARVLWWVSEGVLSAWELISVRPAGEVFFERHH
jgi:hypothetical protein